MKRNRCIVCGARLYDAPLYVIKNMPAVSQNLPTEEGLKDDKPRDFEFCQCSGCGLVQFNDDPVPYYLDSTRAGERCDVLIKLRRQQYRHLIEKYNLVGKKILEVGAGKGGFLKTLKEMTEYDIKEYGIENNPDFVKIAREIECVNVQQGNPENESTILEGAPFEAFTSFAYPARLINPNAMMQMIYSNTTENAVGLIMVPSMEHLLSTGGFYDITADHIAYYDMASLSFYVQKNGFEIDEIGEVAGVYIYAFLHKRKKYDLKTIWSDVSDLTNEVSKFIQNEKNDDRTVAVWCAGHFAFTVLSMISNSNYIEYIIDNAEFKKNRFSPATHIVIKGPEFYKKHPVDTIMILGPMYVEEIVNEIRAKCSSKVKIVTVDKSGLHINVGD